jgi:NSS family neurotransmitter:Na+ symporter
VILAWVLSFFVYAFDQSWGIDTNFFFFRHYLHLFSKTELQHWYSPQWHIVSSLLVVWGLCFVVMKLGLNKGIERVSRYATPIFMVLVLLLMIRVMFVSGAWIGIKALFTPDFTVLSSSKVWSAAYGQVFFSLGLGLSVMLAYASFLPKKTNLNQSALITVIANGVFSLVCAVLVFGMLGVLSHANNQPIDNVVTAGIGLTFVTLPAAINLLPMPTVIGPIFFLGLFLIGFTSQLSLLQTVLSSLEDRKIQQRRIPIIFKLCVGGFALSIFLTGANGILFIDIIDYFTNQIALVFSGFIELLAIAWLYPTNALRQYSNDHSTWHLPNGVNFCLKVLCPTLLATLLFGHAMTVLIEGYAPYSQWNNVIFGGGSLSVLVISALLLNRKIQA